jgi:hypothetical protein
MHPLQQSKGGSTIPSANAGIVDGEDVRRLLQTNCKLQSAGPDRTPKKGQDR